MDTFTDIQEENRFAMKVNIRWFVIYYLVIVFAFLIISPWVFSSDWVSSSDFHSSIEIIGSFIAIAAGIASLVYFFGLRNRFYLIIGLGFFIAGSEDLVHGILSFERLFAESDVDFTKFVPGTYVAGRIMLALMTIIAPILETLMGRTKNEVYEAATYGFLAIVLGGGLTALAFILPLPNFILPDRFISRPVDFISAILFLIAFFIILRRYLVTKDIFSGFLLASTLFNIGGQVYMSFSKDLYDIFFDLAHLANVFSYIMPGIGISMQGLEEMGSAKSEIIKRQKIEKVLKESQQKYKSLFNKSSDAIVLIDHQGIILELNEKIEEIIGYEKAEIRGKNFFGLPFLSEEGKITAMKYFNLRNTGIDIPTYELEFIKKNGQILFGEINATIIELSDGSKCDLVVIRDITERKIANDALKESEERWKSLIKNSPDTILTVDGDGKILFINRIAPNQSLEEFIGVSVYSFISPDQSEKYKQFLERTFKTGEINANEFFGIDGKWYISRFVPIMKDGQIEKVMIIATDITEQKKYEEKQAQLLSQLSVIINSVGDAILVTDKELRITTANPVFLDLIEDKESNVVGKLINDVVQCVDVDGESDSHMNSHIEETVTKGITTECRSQIEISDGRTRAIGSINSPLKDSKGNIIGVVLSMRDISKEVEIDRMKTEFISTVSHELRTPLTSIKGYIDLILEGDTGDINDLQREFLGIVFDNTERLNNLIDDLLDIEKIESGEVRSNITKVSLSDLLGTTLKSMQTSADKKGLKLSSNIPDGAEIYADKDRIVRLFVNLFSNAIKYTKEGEVFIKLTKMKTIHKVVVRDTGIGISKHDQKKIFTRFFRSDDDYAKSAGGTGLGLSIVKAIVEMHGGKIELKSELNKGSEFIVTFPLNHIPDRKK